MLEIISIGDNTYIEVYFCFMKYLMTIILTINSQLAKLDLNSRTTSSNFDSTIKICEYTNYNNQQKTQTYVPFKVDTNTLPTVRKKESGLTKYNLNSPNDKMNMLDGSPDLNSLFSIDPNYYIRNNLIPDLNLGNPYRINYLNTQNYSTENNFINGQSNNTINSTENDTTTNILKNNLRVLPKSGAKRILVR